MTKAKFNPQKHLIKLNGKDYLEVKWRIVWFRQEHESGSIQTELLQYESGLAICKATVIIEGQVIATGIANADSRSGNPIWKGKEIMKAETAAIGRALAHAGFGTQFTGEEEGDFLVDSPVEQTGKPLKPASNGKVIQKQQTASDQNEPEWSEQRTSDFLMNFTTRFPGAHHMTILPGMGVEKLEDLGTRKKAYSKLMEYCYEHAQPVMVNYRRYVVTGKGQKYLELTADPVKKNNHAVIRAYGRSTDVKEWLDTISPDLYTELKFDDYDKPKIEKTEGGESVTKWKPLKVPLIARYEIQGSPEYPYNNCFALELPESEEVF